jgi:hypothetical protein
MFELFKKSKYEKVGFEDIKKVMNFKSHLIINTLNSQEQTVLIKGTVDINDEENMINEILSNYMVPDKPVIIYGKNCCDDSVETKFEQIQNLGIKEVYIYYGGLFEWLLLNELYGNEEFPLLTTYEVKVDIQKFRPESKL